MWGVLCCAIQTEQYWQTQTCVCGVCLCVGGHVSMCASGDEGAALCIVPQVPPSLSSEIMSYWLEPDN